MSLQSHAPRATKRPSAHLYLRPRDVLHFDAATDTLLNSANDRTGRHSESRAELSSKTIGLVSHFQWRICLRALISASRNYHLTKCASGCVVEWADLQSGGCGFESRPRLLRTKVCSAFHPSSYSWEGKGRYGSFRLRMNVWVCR